MECCICEEPIGCRGFIRSFKNNKLVCSDCVAMIVELCPEEGFLVEEEDEEFDDFEENVRLMGGEIDRQEVLNT
jgi:hypothetical protein